MMPGNTIGPNDAAQPLSDQDADLHLFVSSPKGRPTETRDIPITYLQPSPFQARIAFHHSHLEELAQSMRTVGFASRLHARPNPNMPHFFQIAYGERRLRAASLAGLVSIPCDVADYSDVEMIEIGVLENLSRKDLDLFEEASALQMLKVAYGDSIREVADRIGRSRGYVEARLAVLQLPDDLQALVRQREDTVDAARQLAKIPFEERQPLIISILTKERSSREIREVIRLARKQKLGFLDTRQPYMLKEVVGDGFEELKKGIQRDQQTIKNILILWEMIRNDNDEQQALIDAALEQLLIQVDNMLPVPVIASGNS